MTPAMPFRQASDRAMLPLDDIDLPPLGPPSAGPAGAPPPAPAAPPAGVPGMGMAPAPGMAPQAPPPGSDVPPWDIRLQPDGSAVYYGLHPATGKEIIIGVVPPPKMPKAYQPAKQPAQAAA